MSLRVKIVAALLATSLLTLALVWAVAFQRLSDRFDDIARTQSARNFRGDVTAYWLTYGSWDAALKAEPFAGFVRRRQASLAHPDLLQQGLHDTGDVAEAQPLPPLSEALAEAGVASPRPPPPRGRPEGASSPDGPPLPPFRFLLFDPGGRVLNLRPAAGRPERRVTPEERQHAVPIVVAQQVVAYASPIGSVNYSPADLQYMRALRDALAWGTGAAALMAIGLGLVFGTGLSRSLARLTRAIDGMHGGVLRQRVETSARDEVGRLTQAFNRMSDQLASGHEALQASHQTISAQSEQLRELTVRDPLTQLYNRRHFDASTPPMYEQAIRYGRPLSMMIGDIDFFKRVNDQFSHATGDRVLQEVGRLLCDHVRPSDLVARYGGEEFVIAFPETALAEAVGGCERLRRRIEEHPWHEIHPDLQITISMGVCDELALGSVEAMLKAADQRLYEAKHAGRNRVCHQAGAPVEQG